MRKKIATGVVGAAFGLALALGQAQAQKPALSVCTPDVTYPAQAAFHVHCAEGPWYGVPALNDDGSPNSTQPLVIQSVRGRGGSFLYSLGFGNVPCNPGICGASSVSRLQVILDQPGGP